MRECVYTCASVCARVVTCVRMHAGRQAGTDGRTLVRTCGIVHVRMYVCMCVYEYVYIIYKYIHICSGTLLCKSIERYIIALQRAPSWE